MIKPDRRSKTYVPLILLFAVSMVYCVGCSNVNGNQGSDGDSGVKLEENWLVPEHEVIDGGPGQDGIPSIDNPKFAPAGQIDYVADDRRVLGVKRGDEIRAYPHQVLDWHEIINDQFGDRDVTVTYCPLTATGIAWLPRLGSEFGTSGLIFRNNLVAYDRVTGSLWSQMRLRSINGERMGENLDMVYLIDTKWSTWKSMFPDSKVLTTDTGYSRDYQSFAYGEDYSTKDGILLFPTKYRTDNRLNRKARVHAIIDGDSLHEHSTVKVYEIGKFGNGIDLVHDRFEGENYVVIGSSSLSFAVAYHADLPDGTPLTFTPVQNRLPVVMQDGEGSSWTVFGEAVDGPRTGEQLKPAKAYSGYWFGMRDLYRLPEIYQFDEP